MHQIGKNKSLMTISIGKGGENECSDITGWCVNGTVF